MHRLRTTCCSSLRLPITTIGPGGAIVSSSMRWSNVRRHIRITSCTSVTTSSGSAVRPSSGRASSISARTRSAALFDASYASAISCCISPMAFWRARSRLGTMAASMLLKLCATPATSTPMSSCRCDTRSCSASWRRSVTSVMTPWQTMSSPTSVPRLCARSQRQVPSGMAKRNSSSKRCSVTPPAAPCRNARASLAMAARMAGASSGCTRLQNASADRHTSPASRPSTSIACAET